MLTTWWTFTIDAAWKGTVLLMGAGAISVLLWRASAALRHMVWTLALGALLMLPVFEGVLPNWAAAKAVYVPAAREVRVARVAFSAASHRNAPTRGSFPVAFGIWLTGAFFCLWRWRRAIAKVALMQREAALLTGHNADVQEAAEHVGLRGKVQLLRSSAEIVPLAAGIRKPVVLLPASASEWSPERMRVVLLHEMAHIKRSDSLTQALAELTRCLYWFHPFVWLALHRLRVEREHACDDLVLRSGTSASDYASHLLGLARSLKPAELSPAAVSMAGAHFATRIRAILNPKANRRVMGRASAMMACGIAACLVLPLAAMRPQAADPGTVTGTVYDPAGARVPGACIIALQTDSGQKLTTTTDQEGKFSIGPLPEGPWILTVEAPGFATKTVHRVTKNHFDFTLDVGQMAESVTVHGKGIASAAALPWRVRVGGNVVPPKLVYKVEPEYPEDARSRGIHGEVVITAVISTQGTVLSPGVFQNPDMELTKAAIKAVREWRYQPALLNGEPVETVTTITVNFELEP